MSTRPTTPRPSTGRVLASIAVVALAAGAVLTYLGLRNGGGDDRVVLEVVDAVTESPPPTVPPAAGATGRSTPPSATPPNTPPIRAASGDALGAPESEGPFSAELASLSPLADLLGPRFSAVPEPTAPRPRPVGMQIATIDVSGFPIRPVGLEDDGQMEIPDETEIGWYQYGATPGRSGATVLAAHVSWNGAVGPFARLGSVEPGTPISVTLDDGTTRHYEVVERAMYGKLELPRERIWRNSGPEELVLITCGGDFNPDLRRFRENIVVYAVPVA